MSFSAKINQSSPFSCAASPATHAALFSPGTRYHWIYCTISHFWLYFNMFLICSSCSNSTLQANLVKNHSLPVKTGQIQQQKLDLVSRLPVGETFQNQEIDLEFSFHARKKTEARTQSCCSHYTTAVASQFTAACVAAELRAEAGARFCNLCCSLGSDELHRWLPSPLVCSGLAGSNWRRIAVGTGPTSGTPKKTRERNKTLFRTSGNFAAQPQLLRPVAKRDVT